MTTILPKPKLVEKKNLQVQVASLPCHWASPWWHIPQLSPLWDPSWWRPGDPDQQCCKGWAWRGGCEGAQSSSEKVKSSTTSSSPWASCSRSERDIPRVLLLCVCEPRGAWAASSPSSVGGKRERCKSCFTGSEASQGNSLLINPRHSLIYWRHCSSQIASGERCRVLGTALAPGYPRRWRAARRNCCARGRNAK